MLRTELLHPWSTTISVSGNLCCSVTWWLWKHAYIRILIHFTCCVSWGTFLLLCPRKYMKVHAVVSLTIIYIVCIEVYISTLRYSASSTNIQRMLGEHCSPRLWQNQFFFTRGRNILCFIFHSAVKKNPKLANAQMTLSEQLPYTLLFNPCVRRSYSETHH